MNQEVISLLENIKLGKRELSAAEVELSEKNRDAFLFWYSKYADNECMEIKFERIFGLAYFLYIKENIDLYCESEYTEFVNFLSKEFGIRKECLLQILTDYRKLLFS